MTVLDVRTQQRQQAQTASTAAQAALGTADRDLVAAQATLATATDALADLQGSQAKIEASLATAPLPADVNQLELDLESNLRDQQPARAALLDAQEAVALRTAARQRVAGTVERAKADLTAAEAALAAATTDAAAVTAWEATLRSQAIADAKTTAASQTTTGLVDAADGMLEDWLGGGGLLDLVRSRWQDATSQAEELDDAVDRAAAAQDALRKAISPTAGELAEKLSAAARARGAVRWAAEAAVSELEWAADHSPAPWQPALAHRLLRNSSASSPGQLRRPVRQRTRRQSTKRCPPSARRTPRSVGPGCSPSPPAPASTRTTRGTKR